MRRLVIIGAAVAALLATPAAASDLPTKSAAPVPMTTPTAAPADWTGFYVGINGGGAWGDSDPSMTTAFNPAQFFFPATVALINTIGSQHLSPDGGTLGGQIGYNYQTGPLVWGAELDFNYLATKDFSNIGTLSPNGTFMNLNQSVKTDWLFTARPRLGYAFNDNLLLYVTGGLAMTDLKYNAVYADQFGSISAGAVSGTRTGWTIGAGLEYALLRNWSVKLEYLHTDFGTVSTNGVPNATFNVTCVAGTGCANPFVDKADLKTNIVRLGLNYKLN
jgi:outer membrane immunogenic protein